MMCFAQLLRVDRRTDAAARAKAALLVVLIPKSNDQMAEFMRQRPETHFVVSPHTLPVVPIGQPSGDHRP